MQKKIYLVDYKENGQDKHMAIEGASIGCVTDSEVVQMLHFYVGKHNRLTNVAEFTTDMPLDKFYEKCSTPLALSMPHRVLYVDMNEVMKVKECISR